MFRAKSAGSFASKIAHTTTIPALGNKDLRLLQDLITNEKTVLTTLQRLAVDLTRASESLKSWGLGEGEDLGDVLSHATNIYSHISTALNNFANHEHTVRAHLKSIRTREEKLDETKRKRKAVAAKAESADKKLSKMSGENKNLPAQTDLLNKLRDEIRQLDTEIMVEEARLGDFKRSSTRNFMTLKLGGLLEFGEKATIVGELGKLLIEEIPMDPTPPGQPRSFYQAHSKTENLDAEVSRCVGEVVFTPPPEVVESSIQMPLHPLQEPSGHSRTSDDTTAAAESASYAPPPDNLRAKSLSDIGSPPPHDALASGEFGEPGQGQRRFGSAGPIRDDGQRTGGGQFSTFPVKGRTGNASIDQTFSESVSDALKSPEFSAENGDKTLTPTVNVGGSPWDGDEYAGARHHLRNESQDSSQLPYTAYDQGHQRDDSQDALSVDKGVRFRTPSMEVSGMDPVAPGIASPIHSGAGWRGRPSEALYDAPVSPARVESQAVGNSPEFDDDDEHGRNSAAAREVAREMDALNFPLPPPHLQQQQQYGPPSPTIPAFLPPTRPLSIHRAPSPLSPPSAPFAQPRSVSPNLPGSARSVSPGVPPSQRVPSSVTPAREGQIPYDAPPEYPAPSPTLASAPASGGIPAAPRTISAAAFKRPGRTGSDVDVKKRPLPSSPRPAPLRTATGGSTDNLAASGRAQLPPGAQPPDYLPAPEPGSPVTSDYGSLGNVKVANNDGETSGYGQGRFMTHLDD